VRAAVTKRRWQHIAAVRLADRRRGLRPERAAANAIGRIRWRAKHPEAVRCHRIAQRAVEKGELVPRKRCQRCKNRRRLEKHHPDYRYPLRVRWVCKPCHVIEDAERRAREQEAAA
jgi:hypothetical protein